MTTGSRKDTTQLGQYPAHLETTQKGNDEILERSYGETRRSPVQIGAAPPKPISQHAAKAVRYRVLAKKRFLGSAWYKKIETTNDDELPFKLINLGEPDFGVRNLIYYLLVITL